MQIWYRKPPPWLLRAHGEHCQGHVHAPHHVGVGVCKIWCDTCFYPYFSQGMQIWYRKPPLRHLRVHFAMSFFINSIIILLRTFKMSFLMSIWTFNELLINFYSHRRFPHKILGSEHVPCVSSYTQSPSCCAAWVCPFRCPPEASRSAGGIFWLEKRIPHEILRPNDGSYPNIWILKRLYGLFYSWANMPPPGL